jgi:hypothetical protein
MSVRLAITFLLAGSAVFSQEVTLTVDLAKPGKPLNIDNGPIKDQLLQYDRRKTPPYIVGSK